ncbi:MAG: hypothetical protein HFH38_09285 [Lachnospiraceae bacterium]|jgi:hypothetical protein|nr:hypothetical protein [Lachnospiraceae bacterium]
MAVKVLMAVCMLPILPIMYGVMWFSSREKNGILYGVTLWEGAREDLQVQKIRKSYKRNLNFWALICLFLFLLTLLTDYESIMISGQVLWIFLTIICLFLPFAWAHKQMMQQKRQSKPACLGQGGTGGKVFVDVTAAAAKKPKFFRKGLYLGCIFGTMPALAELFLYHVWRHPQMPGLWERESVLLVLAAVVFLFPILLSAMEKQRIPVVSFRSQDNLQLARVRSYQWGKACTALAWASGSLNWGMLLAFHLPLEGFPWVMAGVCGLFSLCSLAILYACSRRIEKIGGGSPADPALSAGDGDEHWIWGIFYYNGQDGRSMVEKRVGIGLTGNMAKPKVRYVTILSMLLLSLYLLGVCAWCVMEEFTPVSLSYEDGAVVASHWKEVYRIPEEDIQSVALMEEEPDMKRRSGTQMRTVKKGNYYDRDSKKDLKACLDPRRMPCLLVEAKDGTRYLLGGSKGGEALAVYHELE